MKPIGPLMREHRLIERMVRIMKTELRRVAEGSPPDTGLITTGVDFFRTYADRTHHGKEEDILFRDLQKKPLSPEHRRTMEGLVADHIRARATTAGLVNARDSYLQGQVESLQTIIARLNDLVNLYPGHIDREDNHFFYPILEYFSKSEQDDMLQEFWEFDRKLIHEKYQRVVEDLERGNA